MVYVIPRFVSRTADVRGRMVIVRVSRCSRPQHTSPSARRANRSNQITCVFLSDISQARKAAIGDFSDYMEDELMDADTAKRETPSQFCYDTSLPLPAVGVRVGVGVGSRVGAGSGAVVGTGVGDGVGGGVG